MKIKLLEVVGGISIAGENYLRQNDINLRQNNKPIKCMQN